MGLDYVRARFYGWRLQSEPSSSEREDLVDEQAGRDESDDDDASFSGCQRRLRKNTSAPEWSDSDSESDRDDSHYRVVHLRPGELLLDELLWLSGKPEELHWSERLGCLVLEPTVAFDCVERLRWRASCKATDALGVIDEQLAESYYPRPYMAEVPAVRPLTAGEQESVRAVRFQLALSGQSDRFVEGWWRARYVG